MCLDYQTCKISFYHWLSGYFVNICRYIYIYIERERERDGGKSYNYHDNHENEMSVRKVYSKYTVWYCGGENAITI